MTKDLWGREIYEVPVIGLFGILKVHRQDLVTTFNCFLIVFKALGSQLFEFYNEDEKTAEAHFVPATLKKCRYFAQVEILRHTTYYLSRLGHFQTQKFITLTILAWARLEEPHQHLSLLFVA